MSIPRPVQVIAVTGGKGGVGKSNVSVNLSLALAELGRRVVLMDADLGLANIDVLLGLTCARNISDVLAGDCTLSDVLVNGPGGIKIVPASSGTQHLTQLGPLEQAGLINAFSELSSQLDVLIIDTAAGISEQVVAFVRAAQEILLVVCDEPTSITDAYALIKVLNSRNDVYRFRILANMVRSEHEGQHLYNKLTRVSERFLEVALHYVGSIPFDETVRKAVQRRRPLYEAYPRSRAALAFKQLAQKVDNWPLPSAPRGNLEFFVERLAHTRQH
jgi:flagellar biosynthesis protein FlhG